MSRIVLILLSLILLSTTELSANDASGHQVGISIGPSWPLTDLGGANKISSPFLRDLDFPATKFGASLFYKYHVNEWVSVRGNLLYGMLHADDAHVSAEKPSSTQGPSDSWFRRVRNFDFKTHLVQFTAMGEVNLKKYDPHLYGRKEKLRWAPYVGGGIGVFWFNPFTKTFSADNLIANMNTVADGGKINGVEIFTPEEIAVLQQYEGEKIKLRKLTTEGQGKPYSMFQFNLSALLGFKFNVSEKITVGIEGWYHQTFTDYLDDIGGNYVSKEVYNNMSPLQKAMAVRYFETSDVEDPTSTYGRASIWNGNSVTASGQERGDNNQEGDAKGKNDQFFSFQVFLGINLFNNKGKSFGCGSSSPYKHKFSCPKW